jgi:hypothetical protein
MRQWIPVKRLDRILARRFGVDDWWLNDPKWGRSAAAVTGHVFGYMAGRLVLLFFAILQAVSVQAQMGDEDPMPADMVYSMKSARCYVFGARAAWGAASRFAGAPKKFKYVATADLEEAFDAGTPSTEGILLDEQLTREARAEMELAAIFGWETADEWINQKRGWPGSSMAVALFHRLCMEAEK